MKPGARPVDSGKYRLLLLAATLLLLSQLSGFEIPYTRKASFELALLTTPYGLVHQISAAHPEFSLILNHVTVRPGFFQNWALLPAFLVQAAAALLWLRSL